MAAGVKINIPHLRGNTHGSAPLNPVPQRYNPDDLNTILQNIRGAIDSINQLLSAYDIGVVAQLQLLRPDGSKAGFLGFDSTDPLDNDSTGIAADYAHIEDTRAIFERGITSTQINDGAHGAVINLRKARGTRTAKTAIQSGDAIGEFEAFGWTGSAWSLGPRMWMEAAENWTGSAQGSHILFGVVPVGSTGAVTALVIDPDKAIRYDPNGNNFKHFFGTSTPEGNVTANPGSTYSRNNSGTGEFWVKITGTGNTGWTQVV